MATKNTTPKCWANVLGGCDGMSGEHVFSNAIFKAGCSCPPIIKGVKRIRDGAPTRGAEKSKILCQHHNSILSPLDETIGKISKFLADSNNKNHKESIVVKGELLERWLLKTVVNNAAAGWAAPVKWLPEPAVTRAIFGLDPVPDGVGLYSVDGIDPSHQASGGVSFMPLYLGTPQGKILGGAYVAVHGLPLLASFHTDLVHMLENGQISNLSTRFSPDGLRHHHRPGAIVVSRKEGDPVLIAISWGGLLRYADGTTAPCPYQNGPSGGDQLRR